MRELLTEYERLLAEGPVGRAVVTGVWGSAPRGPGACLLATTSGAMAGSVSGGCVEGATVEAIIEAVCGNSPRTLTWTVTHEQAWEVGLACGGTIDVLVEPRVRQEWLDAARTEGGYVLATIMRGPDTGSAVLVSEDGTAQLLDQFPDDLAEPASRVALEALAALRSTTTTLGEGDTARALFLEVLPRRPVLFLIGGVHIAAELTRLAHPMGYRIVVADGREGFLTRERFPNADSLLPLWPAEAFAAVEVTSATAICVLSHDPKFDEPALELALRSPAGYIGAIGSKKTQAERRARLRASGFTEAEVARLHGPIGLDLGGREPAEIALAILAEITAVRYGRPVKPGAQPTSAVGP